MTNQELYSMLCKMDTTELLEVNSMVVDIIKAKRQLRDNILRQTIKVGDKVGIEKDRFNGSRFVVEKVNRKRAVLRKENGFQQYNVPFTLIKHLDTWKQS